MTNTRKIISRISICAIASALGFVCTSFLQIPFPGGAGYFNFGDVITILISIIAGPIEGMMVGAISGSFSDLFLGYGSFIPFTLIAKIFLALVSGVGFKFIKTWMKYLFPFLGAISMSLIYMIAYLVFTGPNTMYLAAFDVLQASIGAFVAIIMYLLLLKTKALNFINSKV